MYNVIISPDFIVFIDFLPLNLRQLLYLCVFPNKSTRKHFDFAIKLSGSTQDYHLNKSLAKFSNLSMKSYPLAFFLI